MIISLPVVSAARPAALLEQVELLDALLGEQAEAAAEVGGGVRGLGGRGHAPREAPREGGAVAGSFRHTPRRPSTSYWSRKQSQLYCKSMRYLSCLPCILISNNKVEYMYAQGTALHIPH